MKAIKLSNRYAKSLADIALKNNAMDATLQDMKLVLEACKSISELRQLLRSPIIKTKKKIKIIQEIFSSRISVTTLNFIEMITVKKREAFLQTIAESFIVIYKRINQIETVTVTSVNPLEQDYKERLIAEVKKTGCKKVELIEKTSSDLIGGVIIKYGDKQIDASIKTKINRLKKTLSKNII
tara:strand:- start:28234 stop:28779 length:546 start_codon:yes stop_codon:yes gene_type:complete